MKFIRLNTNTEFFKDDLKATFLGNIEEINIIVGANNTRKSRFLRNIITQDHLLIINSKTDLNRAYHDSKNFFSELKREGADAFNEQYLHFQFHETNTTNKAYDDIKEYFSNNSQINFAFFENTLGNINKTLEGMASDENLVALKVIAQKSLHVVRMFIGIYEGFERNLPTIPQDTFDGKTVYENIRFRCNLPSNTKYPFFEIKFRILRKLEEYLQVFSNLTIEKLKGSLIYIPVLRTSRMIGGVVGDIYAETILKQHFKEPISKLSIETGLMLYKKISLARNGTRKQARDFSNFEKFIGEIFFQSDDLHIVALQSDNKEDKHIQVTLPGENEDVSIQDLGDGVQAIINLLFPIFTASDGSWIFIDEPENHLHPGYQNLLMQTLSSNEIIKGKNLRFFINTHSNHILSGALLSTQSAEIFVFNKLDKDTSSIQTFNGNEYHTLEMLGVLNTSVLTSNCTVWVEGVTDRLYLQSFLSAYHESLSVSSIKPIEGLNYSFVEYGGKNLLHYEFDHEFYTPEREIKKSKIDAYFINTNVFLLADSDFDQDKHNKFENIKRKNFKYFKTELPEIENILPEMILKKYLENEIGCKMEEIDLAFPIDNTKKLGRNFKDKFTYGKSFRKMEADSGGTLRYDYKKGLADYVHKNISNGTFVWKDLEKSEILKKITVELYSFIKQNNQLKR